MLDKYWLKYDEVPAYMGAMLLHPMQRVHYIKKNWKKEWLHNLEPKVEAFWEEYYKDKVIQEVEDISDEDMDNAFLIWNRQQANLARIKDEYSQFINGACLDITVPPYKWWSHPDQRKTYSNLS